MAAGNETTACCFLALAEGTEDIVARIDREMRCLYLNPAGVALVGRPLAELRGVTFEAAALSVESMREAVTRVFAGEAQVRFRLELAQDGRVSRWFDVLAVPDRDAEGEVIAAVLSGRDISTQMHVQAALEESEVRFQAVFENVPVGMAVSTREAHGYATNANSALARMLGYTRAELAQMHFSAFTHPDHVDTDARLLAQVQAGLRDGYTIEKRLLRRDGTGFWAHLSVSAVRDDSGALRYVVGMTEDITERKEIEAELRESEERFRALVERSSDLIAILEPEGHVRYASPSHVELFGYSPEEIIGVNAFDLIHPDDAQRVRERFAEAMAVSASVPPERPIRLRRRDGTWRWLMVTATDLRPNPAIRGIVVNARDVTEELRLQEQLTQAQKMEALGQLAGGVAHDFNNILAAIAGYAELLLLELPGSSPAAEDVREIAKATERGAGVTKQLLAFSRRQTLETEVLDLGAVVADTARMLRALLPATIELVLPETGGGAIPVRAARAQVEQILMNLAVNARDAMPTGGWLTIALAVQPGAAGHEAVLTVADSGSGMSDEVRARAFEPFFTTKAKGQGTGLGLATVYGLVRQFGGRVELQSARGAGTQFTITLPLAGAPADPTPVAVSPVEPATPGARILVAEDEPQLRRVMTRALEKVGYDVVGAADGAAALAAIHGGRPFDLLISDVAMPRLGGRELAEAVDAGWGELPMVLMSGYAEVGSTPESTRDLPANVIAFVEKPFEIERLLQIVAEHVARH